MKGDGTSILPLAKRKAFFRSFLKLVADHKLVADYQNHIVLLRNHLRLLNKEPEWIQELYIDVLDAAFHKRFQNLLTDISFEDGSVNPLALHNRRVERAFKDIGISWDEWLGFDKETSIEVMAYEKVIDKAARWKDLLGALQTFQGCYYAGTVLHNSVRKDCIEIQKKKAMIFNGTFEIDENAWEQKLFPKFHATRDHLFKKGITLVTLKNKKVHPSAIKLIVFQLLLEFVKEPVKKNFSAKLWRRDPILDLFQGNYSDCCISIGEKEMYPAVKLPGMDFKRYPAGILNFLTDLGIQVVELHDESRGVIGQCWLYVALDEGRPVLVADSFDIDKEYHDRNLQSQAIRECMFQFLREYAAACGISKVVLGRSGPIIDPITGEEHKIKNDVRTSDLALIGLPQRLQKLGGYYLDKPYFLESVGGSMTHLIARDIPIALSEKAVSFANSVLPDFLL